jgi:hypothetical protein
MDTDWQRSTFSFCDGDLLTRYFYDATSPLPETSHNDLQRRRSWALPEWSSKLESRRASSKTRSGISNWRVHPKSFLAVPDLPSKPTPLLPSPRLSSPSTSGLLPGWNHHCRCGSLGARSAPRYNHQRCDGRCAARGGAEQALTGYLQQPSAYPNAKTCGCRAERCEFPFPHTRVINKLTMLSGRRCNFQGHAWPGPSASWKCLH